MVWEWQRLCALYSETRKYLQNNMKFLNKFKINSRGFGCLHLHSKADVLCHNGTGNVVSWELTAPVMYQFMPKAGGTGQAIHVLTVEWTYSVVETNKGFSQELVENSSSVSIYIKGGGLQAPWEE